MPWRVSGAVAHIERAVAERDGVGIKQPARWRESRSGREAEHLALTGQTVDQELVSRVRANDGQLEFGRQFSRAAGVVDVGMREPDLAQRQALALDFSQHGIKIATGVDNSRLQRLAAPDDGTVLLEGSHRDGEVT